MSLQWTTAIVRDIPDSFVDAVRMDKSEVVDVQKARAQFEKYVETLKEWGMEIVRLPADERYPDCVFVEDTVVVIGKRALLTTTGHLTRRGEGAAMKKALEGLLNSADILNMADMDPDATLDGGDVLFTGKEIFVGLSGRTNQKGIKCLGKAFPEYTVTSFPVKESLHLKCKSSMAGQGKIIIGGDEESHDIMEQMKAKAIFEYEYIHVNDNAAGTVLLLNDNAVITRPASEIGQANHDLLCRRVQGQVIDVPFGEFYKVQGCLTCCSVLVNA